MLGGGGGRGEGEGCEKGSACQLSYVEGGGNYIGRLPEPSIIKSYLAQPVTGELALTGFLGFHKHPHTHTHTHTTHTHSHTHTHARTHKAGIAALSSTRFLSCWPEPLLCCYLSRHLLDQSEEKVRREIETDRPPPLPLPPPTLAHTRSSMRRSGCALKSNRVASWLLSSSCQISLPPVERLLTFGGGDPTVSIAGVGENATRCPCHHTVCTRTG